MTTLRFSTGVESTVTVRPDGEHFVVTIDGEDSYPMSERQARTLFTKIIETAKRNGASVSHYATPYNQKDPQ